MFKKKLNLPSCVIDTIERGCCIRATKIDDNCIHCCYSA